MYHKKYCHESAIYVKQEKKMAYLTCTNFVERDETECLDKVRGGQIELGQGKR